MDLCSLYGRDDESVDVCSGYKTKISLNVFVTLSSALFGCPITSSDCQHAITVTKYFGKNYLYKPWLLGVYNKYTTLVLSHRKFTIDKPLGRMHTPC